MTFNWFLYLLILHLFADVYLQNSGMSAGKSKEFKILAAHGFHHFSVFGIGMLPALGIWSIPLALLNAVLHCCVDWYLWNGYKWLALKRRWRETEKQYKHWWQSPKFLTALTVDQALHLSSIFLIYGIASICL